MSDGSFGFVITANDAVRAICVGTSAEADAICLRLKTEQIAAARHQLGELAEHLLPETYWAVRRTPILLR